MYYSFRQENSVLLHSASGIQRQGRGWVLPRSRENDLAPHSGSLRIKLVSTTILVALLDAVVVCDVLQRS